MRKNFCKFCKFLDTSVTSELRKRKRAISVDNLNEQKDGELIPDDTNEMSMSEGLIENESRFLCDYLDKQQDNIDEHLDVSKSLKFLCLNFGNEKLMNFYFLLFQSLDPLANGLRRRAQSLNFAIRSSQPLVDHPRQNPSSFPAGKRRRKETSSNLSSVSQPIIKTRKKSSPVIVNHDDFIIPEKSNKTIKRRRRTDPFIRMSKIYRSFFFCISLHSGKRRISKKSDRKNQHQLDISNLVTIPSIDQDRSSESLLPSLQSPLSFTYQSPKSTNVPVTK